VIALVGCGQGTYSVNNTCPKLASATGGDPTGKWKVMSYCQVPYARTAADDWCQKLVYGAAGIADGLFLGTEILPLVGVSADGKAVSGINYVVDPTCGQHCGTYSATLVFEGTTTTNFPLACLRQHVADPTCDDLGAKIQMLVDNNVLPTIQNVQCKNAANGDSCDCTYFVTTSQIAGDAGAWRVENNLLIHYPGLPLAQAGLTDFVVSGDTMSLHGHDGEPLLAHDPLRNLDLVRQ
jgi:hypothetical protein